MITIIFYPFYNAHRQSASSVFHRPIIVYTTANNIEKVEKKYVSCPFYSSSVFKSVTEQLLASLNLLLARYCLSYQSFLLPPTKALCCYTCKTQILVRSIIKEEVHFRLSNNLLKEHPYVLLLIWSIYVIFCDWLYGPQLYTPRILEQLYIFYINKIDLSLNKIEFTHYSWSLQALGNVQDTRFLLRPKILKCGPENTIHSETISINWRIQP